jgi:motility quorum-sensing regulator/GCU-specific mRNA interferase toxin
MGFGPGEMVATIQTMTPQMFYKSMTSCADHRVWQDVYHVPFQDFDIYLKFTADAVTDFAILSFKER